MAEELAYASAGGDSNKRKYEDSPSPVARRATGFSSPPDSAVPPPVYNSVPPPMNEIELAKQKAQEIAARLLNTADPSKRARVENGAGVGGGYDAIDTGTGQKHLGLGLTGPPQSASYGGYPGPSKKIDIPNGRVGVIIGKGGETIKYLQLQSGAKIQVTRDMDADPNSATRAVELMGTPDQIAKAEQLINDVLSEADTGGSGIVTRRVPGQSSGAEQFVMMVPNNKVGLVIGKGGETIKNMQARTGARVQVIPLHLPPGDMSKERTVQIDGTSEQIEAAKLLVNEVISENRMRNQSMSGGYPQQGGYQARPPTNWSQPGPPMQQQQQQQPGYGYVQPGAYPGPPQYNQPPYSAYNSQPASGGYAASWDQSTAQNPQSGAGSYDYYNQQQQQPPSQQPQAASSATPTDSASGYGYGQTQAYSQGYGQDGYSGYQTGAAQTGYDQQQQGYNNSSYGNVSNPAPDGQTPSYSAQGGGGETNQAPPPGPGGYGAYAAQPASGYGGYGTPQGQKPQQSPSAQGGGYAQPPPGQVSGGYSAGYGAQPYGAPAPSYGQQQAAAYGGAYGGGYSQQQPAAYSSEATPPQSAQPAGAAKASPPS